MQRVRCFSSGKILGCNVQLGSCGGPKTFSYDPFYISRKPPIPLYPKLQFCLKGYDFPMLERYEKYIARVLKRWAAAVDSFPLPPKKTLYKLYYPNSTKVRVDFDLSLYCRIVCAEKIKTVDLPIIFDLFQQNLPEGIHLTVEEVRFFTINSGCL
ncbi:unnamed protein product [Mesocestoides corti]|uniref:Small ribosomal subunit protein uS10 domain-containing protein n=1 Tax=Mesocestoides corti TaxID=53468 RepID=A0A0R3UNU3_MESCO|nr:unnamed protein product [Mesocestoides corti]